MKRKNVDDEGNRKKYKNTEKQHENGKYDKWVVLIKPHNGCDANCRTSLQLFAESACVLMQDNARVQRRDEANFAQSLRENF